jgi:hypothetical protein
VPIEASTREKSRIARAEARARRLVVIVAGLVVAVAAVWIVIDRTPPEWDHANHLERSVHCAADLDRHDWRTILARSSFYPPLVPCLAGTIYRWWPSDVAAAQTAVWAFLVLGMAGTYGLGRRFGGPAAGAMAAVLFGTAPFTAFSMLRFQLDLPLAAMVAVFLLALLAAADFRHSRWAILSGVLFGLGMLTKPTFALYAFPAVALAVGRIRRRRALMNALVGALVAIILSLPWYGPRLLGLSGQIGRRSFEQAAESGHAAPWSIAALSFYPTWLIPQFGVIATILLCVGAVAALRRRQPFLLVALLIPFAVAEVIQNKNLRYTLPLLPAAAALGGLGFASLPERPRLLAAVGTGILAAVQIVATAAGWPAVTLPGLGVPLVLASPPRTQTWGQREILEAVARHHQATGADPARISVVPNHAYFSVSNFRYYALRDGHAMEFMRAWDGEPVGVEYMILKDGDVGPEWTAVKPRRIEARLASDPNFARVFPVLMTLPLPDSSRATVRVRQIGRDLEVEPGALAAAIEAAFRRALPAFARDVEALSVSLVHDDTILGGHVGRAEITATTATIGELERRSSALRVHDLRLVLDDVLVNPWAAHAGRLELLDIGRVRIAEATIQARDLQAFLGEQPRTRTTRVTLGDGFADLGIEQRGPDVSARVRVMPAPDRPFAMLIERVRVGGVAVPAVLAEWVARTIDPSRRIARRLPVPVEIGDVTVTPDAVRIVTR